MSVSLDHAIVPARDPVAGARFLAGLLAAPWEESRGEFSPVYVNDGLTLDFQQRDEFSWNHFCFRVSDDAFDEIFDRVKEQSVPYRSTPRGETDMEVRTRNNGKNIYWTCGDGHIWEILTVSYARIDSPTAEPAPTG